MQYLFAYILHYIESLRNSHLYHVYLLQFGRQFLPDLENKVEREANICSVPLQTSTFQTETSFVTVQSKQTAKEGERAGGKWTEDFFIFLRFDFYN